MKRDRKKKEFEKIEEFAILKGKEALEIGCGKGEISEFLISKVKNLTAIDPDKKALEKAKATISNVNFRIGSGEKLEFENNSFDLIFFTFSLHHQNSKKALKEAFRTLRKDGQVIIIEPRKESLVQQIFDLFENEDEKLNQALEAIEKSDFEIEKKEIFFTEWIFENKEDLYKYFFEYFNVKTRKKITEINKLLGEKINTQPIVLKDKPSIFSLKKR